MAPRTRPPFRADHVGSLLRPPALLRARAARAAGTISADQLTRAEDDAIRDAVAMQEAAGLRSATDGEFRRAEWHTDFIARLGGIGYAATWTPVPVFGSDTETIYEAHGTEVTGQVHLAEVLDRRHHQRVVHERVHLAELRHGNVCQVLGVRGRGEVGRHDQCAAAQVRDLLGHFLEPAGGARGEHDIGAGRSAAQCDLPAKIRPDPGHDHHFVFQKIGHQPTILSATAAWRVAIRAWYSAGEILARS